MGSGSVGVDSAAHLRFHSAARRSTVADRTRSTMREIIMVATHTALNKKAIIIIQAYLTFYAKCFHYNFDPPLSPAATVHAIWSTIILNHNVLTSFPLAVGIQQTNASNRDVCCGSFNWRNARRLLLIELSQLLMHEHGTVSRPVPRRHKSQPQY